MLIYCGSYNNNSSVPGIHILDLDVENKSLKIVESVESGINPSFLCFDKQRLRIFAVNESAEEGESAVSVFRVSPGGRYLKKLITFPIPGKGPCHLSLSANEDLLFTADYTSGTISVLELDSEGLPVNGEIFIEHQGVGTDPERQEGPHIHSVYCNEKYIWCVDLGLDEVVHYSLSGKKKGDEYATKYMLDPGAGPRMMVFCPGRKMYIAEELTSMISVLEKEGTDYDYTQRISTLPEGWSGNNTAGHIEYDEKRNLLYVSNRGHDSIAVFSDDCEKGELILKQHYKLKGKCPRFFTFSPDKNFLLAACQESNSIECLAVSEDGTLSEYCSLDSVQMPTCISF